MRRGRRPATRASVAVAVVLATVGGGGCSDDDSGGGDAPTRSARQTSFGKALTTVGSGTIPIGTGYGFIDVEALRRAPDARRSPLGWAARALGPGGSEIVVERDEIRRRTGIDVAGASRLLSVAASYTLGVRIDGADPSPLRRRLLRSGSARGGRGDWELFDLGPVSSIRFGTPVEALGPFGPRLAFGDRSVVAARRDQSRRDLIGRGDPPLDDPAAALAVACLGEVVAARIVPNNFTHWPNSGPELLAFGVQPRGGGPPREVLCATDPDPDLVDDAAAAISDALAPDAVDAVTDEAISDLIAGAEVEVVDGEGAAAARAGLELAPGRDPGFLFGAFVRGSLVTYLGLRPPEPAGDE